MLTESQVRDFKDIGKDYNRSDDTRGRSGVRLILTVRKGGRKEWRIRTIQGGKRRFRSIGTYPKMSLEDARAALSAEPGEERTQGYLQDYGRPALSAEEIQYGTVGELMKEYQHDMQTRGKRSHDEFRKCTTGYVKVPFPDVWSMPANKVDADTIKRILSYHISRGVTTQTNRLRSWLHAAFQYALKADNNPRRTGKVRWGAQFNPVALVPSQKDWERAGELVMTSEDIRGAWFDLPKMTRLGMTADMTKLCIATAGQRLVSLVRLRIQDVHLDRGLIDFPASSMKASMPHVLPITHHAQEILERWIPRARARGAEYIFTNRNDASKHMSDESPAQLVARYREKHSTSGWAIEDVRRTAKTVLGELGVSKESRDRLQGHAMLDVSRRHYDRYDYLKEKREAMSVWEAWLTGVLQGNDLRAESN